MRNNIVVVLSYQSAYYPYLFITINMESVPFYLRNTHINCIPGICDPNPCLNSGICWQLAGSLGCDCPRGFEVQSFNQHFTTFI